MFTNYDGKEKNAQVQQHKHIPWTFTGTCELLYTKLRLSLSNRELKTGVSIPPLKNPCIPWELFIAGSIHMTMKGNNSMFTDINIFQ